MYAIAYLGSSTDCSSGLVSVGAGTRVGAAIGDGGRGCPFDDPDEAIGCHEILQNNLLLVLIET